MYKVLIFAGTVEGRTIAEYLSANQISCHACVATQYGESLLHKGANLTVSHDRMTDVEMEELMRKPDVSLVIDATHPYAAVVTDNVKAACERCGKEYLRLVRETTVVCDDQTVYVDSVKEAVAFLENTKGSILAATGSKELAEYTQLSDYQERVYARVLSLPEVVAQCAELGFTGKHLICMQGPFTKEMNIAMIRQFDTKWLVSKESGSSGGFPEKYEAALETGSRLVLIGRPRQEEGVTLNQCKALLQKRFSFTPVQEITFVGIGMGTKATLTIEGEQALKSADLIIGAKRMADGVNSPGQPVFYSYKPEEIRMYIEAHPEYEKIAIALSGDVGFYSGAKKLIEVLNGDGQNSGGMKSKVKLISGISSMVYLCSRLQTSWEDIYPCSIHGRELNLISLIQQHPRVFAIVGKTTGISEVCKKLTHYGMGAVRIFIGEQLSYPEEKISMGFVRDYTAYETDGLSVMLLENDNARNTVVTHGMPDQVFLRDKAPMTKEEIRSVSLSKLRLQEVSIVYDIGAGTGSVSIEIAKMSSLGSVYAIEKNPEAITLLYRNKQKFAVDHLTIIEGLAPEACEHLPAPTHAFIGGSSGNLKEIMQLLLRKNPNVRIVINCITLETVAEALDCLKTLPVTDTDIVQIGAGKSKEIGSYHMMMGQNPIYIISCQGGINP